MSARHWYIKFDVADYLQDTRHLSLAAKGAWMDIICFMFNAPVRGILSTSFEEIGRSIGCSTQEAKKLVDELCPVGVTNARQICDRCDNDNGRVTLTCRRMIRENKDRQDGAERKRRSRAKNKGEGDVSQESHNNVTPDVTAKSQGELELQSELYIKTSLSRDDGGKNATQGVTLAPPADPHTNPAQDEKPDDGMYVTSLGWRVLNSIGIAEFANAANARELGRLCESFGSARVLSVAHDASGKVSAKTGPVIVAYVSKVLANEVVAKVAPTPRVVVERARRRFIET